MPHTPPPYDPEERENLLRYIAFLEGLEPNEFSEINGCINLDPGHEHYQLIAAHDLAWALRKLLDL